jgi:hypothetical protein
MTPQQLRDTAELIEQINARDGLALHTPIGPNYLRREAERMEQETP